MIRISSILLFICIATFGYSQTSHKLLRTGDAAYNDGDFEKAEINYRKSLETERSLKGNFNLGNAVYRQERYEEAIQFYESAANDSENDLQKSESFYNLGNTHLRMGAFEEAVDAYKYASTLNPEDLDVRKNLYIAKLMYKQEQQQQQQQQQEENQEQEQQEQENQDQENQDQEQQDQQQGEGDQEQEEQEQQSEDDQEQEEGEQDENTNSDSEASEQEPTQELSKEDAEKLLQVIENEEQKVQEKLRKVGGKKKKPTKDW